MQKIIISVGAGFFAGALCGFLIATPGEPATPSCNAPGSAKVATQSTLGPIQAELEGQKAVNASLKARIAALEADKKALPAAPALDVVGKDPAPKAGTFPFGANFGEMMKKTMTQQREDRMLSLKSRLRLDANQESTVRNLLQKHQEKIEQGLDGKGMPIGGAAATGNVDVDSELAKILTPDQQVEYKKFEQEEKNSALEMMSNVEMSQIQTKLQLTEAQKDQVFNALVAVPSMLEEQMKAEATTNSYQPIDPKTLASKSIERMNVIKKIALKPILSPEQFSIYEKHLDNQAEMVKGLMQGMLSSPAGKK